MLGRKQMVFFENPRRRPPPLPFCHDALPLSNGGRRRRDCRRGAGIAEKPWCIGSSAAGGRGGGRAASRFGIAFAIGRAGDPIAAANLGRSSTETQPHRKQQQRGAPSGASERQTSTGWRSPGSDHPRSLTCDSEGDSPQITRTSTESPSHEPQPAIAPQSARRCPPPGRPLAALACPGRAVGHRGGRVRRDQPAHLAGLPGPHPSQRRGQ